MDPFGEWRRREREQVRRWPCPLVTSALILLLLFALGVGKASYLGSSCCSRVQLLSEVQQVKTANTWGGKISET